MIKRSILSLVGMLLATLPLMAQWNFSAVSPSGHTLYYYQTNSHEATLVSQNGGYTNSYDNLTGRVVVPSKVLFGRDSLTVTQVSIWTFAGCSGLTSVVFPPTLSVMSRSCLFNCQALRSVYIGAETDSIEEHAIDCCYNLDSIIVDTANTHYHSRDNCNAVIRTADSTLLLGCRRTVIPSTVRHIGPYAFYGCEFETIDIPEGIRTIGNDAFHNCSRLNTLHLPSTLRTIGESAFYYCTALADLQLNEGLESIGVNAFYHNESLTTVTLPTTLKILDAFAFAYCRRLHTLHYNPDSCIQVGRYYFGIDNTTFFNCESLETLTIGPNVRHIAANAFRNLTGISEVTLPSSLRTVGESAFEGCTGLTRVNFDGTLGNWCSIEFSQRSSNPLFYTHRLYVADTLVTRADIPEGVIKIGSYAFADNTALRSATLPSTVESIGFAAFLNCTSLREITIESPTIAVRGRAFEGCGSLTHINSHALRPDKAGPRAFEQVNTNLPVYIPIGSRSQYEEAWSPLNNFIETLIPSGPIPPPTPQAETPVLTTMGTDFWCMFLCTNHVYSNGNYSLVITGEKDAVVTIEQPCHHWDTIVCLSGGGSETVLIPTDRAVRDYNTSPEIIMGHGIHVSSTAPIALFAADYAPYSYDMATIYPTATLDTQYIVQGYPSKGDAIVGLLAIEDNTILQIHTACNSLSHTDGSSVTLMRGQTLQLTNNCGSHGNGTFFNGMEVVSNGKPFALFSGSSAIMIGCDVPDGDEEAADHCYEQATPFGTWGQRYLLTSSALKGGDWVVVTASKDSTVLTLDGAPLDTIHHRQHHIIQLPTNTALLLEASAPVGVSLYFTGYECNYWGDPSSVTLPHLDQGTSIATFNAVSCESVSEHFVNLCASLDAVPYITLDDNPIGSHFSAHNPTLSYARLKVTPGTHTLRCDRGVFTGWFYGLGKAESYTYPAAMSLHPQGALLLANGTLAPTSEQCLQVCADNEVELIATTTSIDTAAYWTIDSLPLADSAMRIHYRFDTPGLHHVTALLRGECTDGFCDTVEAYICVSPTNMDTIEDSFCLGEGYQWRNRTLDSAGTYTFLFSATVGCDTLLTLNLTASGQHVEDTIQVVLDEGDSIIIDGITYSQAGYYHHGTYPLPSGCDSVVTVHVTVLHHEPLVIHSDMSTNGICLGDTVVLTATPDTATVHWVAIPPDPSLNGRDTCHRIKVTPLETTTYSLLEQADTSITIQVFQHPVPCIEILRDYIDFDDPLVLLNDCSEYSTSSLWQMPDGINFSGANLQQRLTDLPENILPIILVTCNHVCCADTSITLPIKYNSYWFPNVFTPGKETNQTFGIHTRKVFAEYELIIYNRLGQKIFHTTDPTEEWDGTHNGQPLPQGAYAYHYFIHITDNGNIRKSGAGIVTLLR